MEYRRFATAAEFSEAVLPTLKKHEIQNNLFFINIYDGPGKIMCAVYDEGEPVAVAIRSNPFPLLIYEADNIRRDDAVRLLAERLAAEGAEFTEVNTEPELAKSFTQIYGELTGKRFAQTESLILYLIDRAPDERPEKGRLRLACERDFYCLPYWCADFFPACRIGSYDLESATGKMKTLIGQGNLYVWEDEVPASIAAVVREVTDCKMIGYVYTPVELRGRGYARACVGELTRRLLEQGSSHVALYADAANPISNAVYRRLGYREIFRYVKYSEV